jgi:hypothetical protein
MILAKKSLSEFRPGKKKNIGTEKKEQIFLDFKISFFFRQKLFFFVDVNLSELVFWQKKFIQFDFWSSWC